MKTLRDLCLVFIGGGIGAVSRYYISTTVSIDLFFPLSTLLINIAGSLTMGAVTAVFVCIGSVYQSLRLLIATGVLGGFTTFSAFSLETVALVEQGYIAYAAVYVFGSVILSILSCAMSFIVVKRICEDA